MSKWTSWSLIDSCYCHESNLCYLEQSENSEVKMAWCRIVRVAPGFEVVFDFWRLLLESLYALMEMCMEGGSLIHLQPALGTRFHVILL